LIIFPGALDENWTVSDSVVQDLAFLGAALKESQRLISTSSTGLEKVVPQGGRKFAGEFLLGGTLVSVPTTVVMHDESIYENPNDYLPDRWLAEDTSKITEHFHPFGVGQRSCIERNFAWMEMTMCLATLLKLFTSRRVTEEPTQMKEAFTLKPAECWITIERR
jgi:benzoate 4-monooxygenase